MIAERAEVSIATVYNHFPGSTSEIFIEVGNRLINDAAELTAEVLEAEGLLPLRVSSSCGLCRGSEIRCRVLRHDYKPTGRRSRILRRARSRNHHVQFSCRSGLDPDHRTRDAARTIGYLVRGAIFAFASHATTDLSQTLQLPKMS